VAADVMAKQGIVIDDLFAAITPHLSTMQNPNDVHFNGQGYDFLGQTVAKAIASALTK
jgi:lysophospholipase L1-like esterase